MTSYISSLINWYYYVPEKQPETNNNKIEESSVPLDIPSFTIDDTDQQKKPAFAREYPYTKSNAPYVPITAMPKCMVLLTTNELLSIINRLRHVETTPFECTESQFKKELKERVDEYRKKHD